MASVAIVGASGSGKTTLLGILAGLDAATDGAVRLVDADLSQLDEEARALVRGQYMGFVFQSFFLLPKMNAIENVMLPLQYQDVSHHEAQERAESVLKRMGLDRHMYHTVPYVRTS